MPNMSIKIVRSAKFVVRSVVFLLFTSYCLLFTDVSAAPCYGTRLPAKKKLHMGFQSYSIFNRYLEHEAGSLRSQQQFFLLSLGLYDWFALDLKGGAGFIKQHPLGRDEVDYPTYMGGGYGFRLKLYETKNTRWVFGFQHISIHPKSIDLGPTKQKALLDDWQFSTLLSYDFKKIMPYLGARWSRADYIHWIDGERDRVRSDLTKGMGLIVGFDMPLTNKIWLNCEGQLLGSEALALSLNFSL